ncbi:MAG TPA: class I SAM-dependent methyltransferase [Longimicrobium sp.]|jgi:SAM-dependent methyltransferase
MPAPTPAPSRLRRDAKHLLRAVVPLSARKRLAAWIGRQHWLAQRHWWSVEMVRDLAERDVSGYHRFLWANHLGYAETYEPGQRFGAERVQLSRLLLFDDLARALRERGADPGQDVRSVLEVGCSMGYLLRYLELELFPAAEVLEGIDIDGYAVARGAEVLSREGSRARLLRGDMADLPRLVGDRRYDVVLCAGVLMYLREPEAAEVVRAMLERTGGLLALAGLAHPEADNARLPASVPRESDRSLIHNLDAMVERAGGRVVHRRWEGARKVGGNTLYFVFAEPAGGARWASA